MKYKNQRKRVLHIVWAAAVAVGLGSEAFGGIAPFDDKDAWFAAAGGATAITTIDFTGFADGTIITDQYQSQGVTFFDGNDRADHNLNVYPNDNWGLSGVGDISLEFETPINWIAAEYPGGDIGFELYRDGQLLSTTVLSGGAGPIGNFSGLKSSEAFDAAILFNPSGGIVFIDDLHFVIPAPSAIFIVLGSFLIGSRRRSCI